MRGATRKLRRQFVVLRQDFNPRSSCEERLRVVPFRLHAGLFQSTLLMRGATIERLQPLFDAVISIHAPHARSDSPVVTVASAAALFQSTLLMRGATRVRKERAGSVKISIHAPHARSDTLMGQSRPHAVIISIHAPHARSDTTTAERAAQKGNFNPRSSCEERPRARDIEEGNTSFQSTLLMRGATKAVADRVIISKFQSTLLMRGATVSILGIDLPDFIIYFSRTYPFSPKMPTSRHLSCKLHFLCDGTSHFGDL